jgi:hypothetical protein
VNTTLDERRTLLPGVLALFGLQFVAVFTSGFQDGLDGTEQGVHLAAIALVALALAALVSPAATLQQAGPSEAPLDGGHAGRRSAVTAMLSLGIAIPLELFLAACVILRGPIAIALGIAALALFLGLWFVLPLARRPR